MVYHLAAVDRAMDGTIDEAMKIFAPDLGIFASRPVPAPGCIFLKAMHFNHQIAEPRRIEVLSS